MSTNPADKHKPSQNTSSIKTTESSKTMEKIDLIYLKLTINAIPTLTQDNFSLWHTQILHYLDCLSLKSFFLWTARAPFPLMTLRKYKQSLTQKLTPRFMQTSSLTISHLSMLKTVLKCGVIFPISNLTILIFSASSLKQKRPSNSFMNISTAITLSGSTITPDLVLNHLRLHANQLAIETSPLPLRSKFHFSPMPPKSANIRLIIHSPIIPNLGL
ncbi:hypothetical protein VP01_1696g4 [Puccinia sorghi]|uniref:Uncharacterized protein n=1 Tax=Puccinia sorghi TaxID=27349 RepID=A0A0L6VHL7_9BASI|nr:hypothetical protein VP01_1696g4 [Puccinia sorghi]